MPITVMEFPMGYFVVFLRPSTLPPFQAQVSYLIEISFIYFVVKRQLFLYYANKTYHLYRTVGIAPRGLK